MSRRRLTALAAVVAVAAAVTAIVLVTVGSDDGGDSGAPSGAKGGPPAQNGARRAGGNSSGEKSSGSGSSAPGTGGAGVPSTALPVLDKGRRPARGGGTTPTVSTETLDLSKLGDGPAVLNVWTSDCLACRSEARALESQWERFGPRGVLFVGLDVKDRPDAAKRYRSQLGVTYAAVADSDGSTARALGATSLPETFFLTASGKVASHVVGAVSLADLELGIRAAQSGRELRTSSGGSRQPLP